MGWILEIIITLFHVHSSHMEFWQSPVAITFRNLPYPERGVHGWLHISDKFTVGVKI